MAASTPKRFDAVDRRARRPGDDRVTVYVPRDAAALSLGADEWRARSQAEADSARLEVKIVRNGSRGLFWLEPLVEVETPAGPRRLRAGRRRATSPGLFDAGFLAGRRRTRCASA